MDDCYKIIIQYQCNKYVEMYIYSCIYRFICYFSLNVIPSTVIFSDSLLCVMYADLSELFDLYIFC